MVLRTVFAFLFGLVTGVAAVYVMDGPLDFQLIRHQAGVVLDDAGRNARALRMEGSVRAALALQKDFSLIGGGIDVNVEEGDEESPIVVLSGTVRTEDQRKLAELITRGVEGVGKVVNRLKVDPESDPDGG